MDKLYIVVPCYKEQAVLPETARRLQQKMEQLIDSGRIHQESRVVFVNDGSTDQTWPIIQRCLRASTSAATEAIKMRCWPG